MAGLIVGIVALPLAIAFAIASGVTPEKGLYTAIIAGFLISALGGSRVQIGGPTGAFIVIVFGIVQDYGVSGLTIATFLAGIMVMIMGFARLGAVIKYIPHSLIVGFTSGIALIIFSSQVKDFFELEMGAVPADFLQKWTNYFHHMESVNLFAVGIGLFTVIITLFSGRIITKIPGSLIAIILSTVAVSTLSWPVETIGSRFGDIPTNLPTPTIELPDWDTIRLLIEPAFTIALLCSVESLLSAVVADGMIGGNHRSNTELIAQGLANMGSAIFGGMPATGAIARTVTNVKNGGRTPVAGIIHAFTLLIIMIFIGRWAKLIPLSCLAGILVVVAYNMSEWKSFLSVLRGPREDIIVLLATFFLTVLVDLTVAIEIGMVLAAFLFMRSMAQISKVKMSDAFPEGLEPKSDPLATEKMNIPAGVEVYEINGPLFFGAVHNFKEAMRSIHSQKPEILILRMRTVPFIDASGLNSLLEFVKSMHANKVKVILSGVQPEVAEELKNARIDFLVGRRNICPHILAALDRAREVLDGAEGN
jgi:SulP family sulfate permease